MKERREKEREAKVDRKIESTLMYCHDKSMIDNDIPREELTQIRWNAGRNVEGVK